MPGMMAWSPRDFFQISTACRGRRRYPADAPDGRHSGRDADRRFKIVVPFVHDPPIMAVVGALHCVGRPLQHRAAVNEAARKVVNVSHCVQSVRKRWIRFSKGSPDAFIFAPRNERTPGLWP